MPRVSRRLLPLLVLAALALPAVAQAAPDRWFAAPISAANDASSPGSAGFLAGAPDGSRVLFVTADALTPDDTDSAGDVYERAGAKLTLLSTAAPGAPDPGSASFTTTRASADASTIVFQTNQSMTTDDTDDGSIDLFEHSGGVTRLVTVPDPSIDPGFDFPFISPLVDVSPTGRWVAFATTSQLSPDDSDFSSDVYVWDRDSGVAELASGDDSAGASLLDAGGDASGERVFLQTTGSLLPPEDSDGQQDIYAFDTESGDLTLETPGTAETMAIGDISPDGSHLFYKTTEKVLPADADSERDVYQFAGGQTTLVSSAPGAPSEELAADYQRTSADGSFLFFSTAQQLVPEDDDGGVDDVYRRDGADGSVRLVTAAPGETLKSFNSLFGDVTPDGEHAFMYTSQDLTPDDTDGGALDAFMWSSSDPMTRISVGEINDGAFEDGSFAGYSSDLSRLFFQDTGQRAVEDTDSGDDLYSRSDGHTALVSVTREPCALQPSFRCVPEWHGVSRDGRRVWIHSDESLVPGDADDGTTDVYEMRLALPGTVGVAGDVLTYHAGDGAVPVDGSLSASDPYDDVFGASVRIASRGGAGADALALSGDLPDGIDAVVSGDAVTLSGRASDADYRDALRLVTFENPAAAPAPGVRSIEFTIDNGAGPGAAATRRVEVPAPAPVERPQPPPGGGGSGGPGPPPAPPAVAIRDTGVWVAHLRRGRVFRVPGLVFYCPRVASASCVAAVAVTDARGRVVAKGSVTVPPSETRGLRLRLRVRMARGGRLRLTGYALYALAGSKPAVATKHFRLLAPPRRGRR